ncbi:MULTISPECIES: ABC transporter ATP-binding protein [unclassified Mesorhizobium]|uniref:dipeptide ABC transporter ATP-binding protein n=1 Tax=unclassified Mesorhizobium TaxID=325217 RepID=UPI001127E0F0|nr:MULTISPECIES: ABC transporter ATP-binding protein [unclassified Mesorhizobium]TPJ45993.1 ABC transporter ATP-binding protein [Mesorhizobium sp. B2-6-6]MBZ9982427.1 ABC transporter ATP-binding protein [Mesorhizobium sp. BR-1-1-8]MCA0008482.1 ABC transporter ATP-binding protein [Mesorhizobium sp. B264B1B]MCA0021310.1 ABC transporter ATP-binding protein [Mesorhizobium sp. B264B1A]MCA0026321.1 ABC transporter ATP-binding protein [Mesorhizobium sp. B263B1A]
MSGESVSILEISGLSVDLALPGGARRAVLQDVNLSVSQDEVLGIIGESGSGKTVLSRALVNWISPPLVVTGGTIAYHGRNLFDLAPAEMQRLRGRKVAYIGSDPGSALDPTIPVGQQIIEKLRAVEPGISTAEAKARVLRVLDAVRIPSPAQRFHEFPFQFSGGMMQRVLIVDALVTNPDLLVADNITQPLDVTVAAQILRLLRDLQRDFRTAVIFVSSALGVVNEIADNVLVLADGRVVECQQTRKLIDEPQHNYTRNLIKSVPRIWGAEQVTAAPGLAKDDTREIILSVRDVYRSYATKDRERLFAYRVVQAVRGVSFDVYKGDNLGIVGESGCGKSTLSRLLSRLEAPNRGQILFKGQDIAHLGRKKLLDLRRRFQLLLQDPYNAIPPHLAIGRTIAEPLRIHGGMSAKEIGEKVAYTMNEVGLRPELTDKLPVGLSAGQRQRVNIARAMVLDPELLILDETLSALDQVEQGKLLDLFERLQARHGMTYIYISHDLSMVRRVCNRVAVMYLGRIAELAGNEATFFDPGHPYTRALLSAVPAIEHKPYDTATYLLEGEPPDPIDIPSGCTFRTRCPFAFDRCVTEDPALLKRSDVDYAACHLVEAGLSAPRLMPAVDLSGP